MTAIVPDLNLHDSETQQQQVVVTYFLNVQFCLVSDGRSRRLLSRDLVLFRSFVSSLDMYNLSKFFYILLPNVESDSIPCDSIQLN